MTLRTPRDWYRRDRRRGAAAWLVSPIAWAWAAVTARRIARASPFDPGAPVICVGNLTVGGAGKTPIVRELTPKMAPISGRVLASESQ